MSIAGSPTGLNRLLRLFGFVAVVLWSLYAGMWNEPWVIAGAALSWLGWAVWFVAPAHSAVTTRIILCAMVIGGGLTATRLAGSSITVMVAVFAAMSLGTEPVVIGLGISALAAVCTCLSVLTAPESRAGALGLLGGLAVMVVAGYGRRQSRAVDEQNRLLVEQNRVIRAERDRAAAMAERGRLARDIHDVLAHTLGGLVLQLDAADALLEAGDVPRAAERVKASHRLAVSGLEEARGVVNALRADGLDLATELARLAEDHRAAGGQVRLLVDAELRGMDEQTAVAVARAVQEALTNARKHAPGQPVTVTIRGQEGSLAVEVSNPVTALRSSLSVSGVGAGLLGMTERIAAVGGTVDARKEDREWRVRVLVPRR
ncbi:hypothetical protein KO481_17690 [Nocardia sp. NEAU-G5]|uniref:histidine kinase n=1 Tax=Nocardia albiluteola TaxID=2842303 RepID=A0ABS6AZQ1_9NOCA|nr:histidine kinase [Nocardia albiluteola]MBU3063353.1 hypothetical protein [Nocardia albiluteola]